MAIFRNQIMLINKNSYRDFVYFYDLYYHSCWGSKQQGSMFSCSVCYTKFFDLPCMRGEEFFDLSCSLSRLMFSYSVCYTGQRILPLPLQDNQRILPISWQDSQIFLPLSLQGSQKILPLSLHDRSKNSMWQTKQENIDLLLRLPTRIIFCLTQLIEV